MADFSFSDDQELQKLSAQVEAEPEEFENWEKLVRAAETQEGGLNRNSSPNAIAATRDTYDQFLARFPLFYGFWKRYADLEFAIGGTEAAEMVYERGVASIGNSVDLWTNYCAFKVETSHDADVIRELFERGADSVGLDFLAHPFWDKYIEFEERTEDQSRIFKILSRIVDLALHQYAVYFERYRAMSASRDINELVPGHVIAQFQAEIQRENSVAAKNPTEMERELRSKIDALQWGVFNRTQAEVTKRWTYEQGIKRPYYHVTDLDDEQLTNWKKYLDFEEAEGDYARIKFLYERCLVTAANYDEIWFRYARWMTVQKDKIEEVRNIYQRASCIYVPISQPAIRLSYAKFEEANGRPDVAIAIHEAVLAFLPSHSETIKSLVNLHRRQHGVEAAIEVLQKYVSDSECSSQTRGALVAEWARILWRSRRDLNAARQLYQSHQSQVSDCYVFWASWLQFEIDQPSSEAEERSKHKQVRAVHTAIRQQSSLPAQMIKDLSAYYSQYLEERGGKDSIKEQIDLDVQVNGPASVQTATQDAAAPQPMVVENGHSGVDVADAHTKQGATPYAKDEPQQSLPLTMA